METFLGYKFGRPHSRGFEIVLGSGGMETVNPEILDARRPYDHEELLVLLRYHPLMMTRVVSIDWDPHNRSGHGALHAEYDITANYVRAMAKANLVSPCEQALAFYLHQALAIPASARTHLIYARGVSYRGDVSIPDDMEFLGIWVDIQYLDVHDTYADAYGGACVGHSRTKTLVQVQNLVVRIEV